MNRKTIKSPKGRIMSLCIIALTSLIWAFYNKYQVGSSELQKQINPAFRQAINEELDSRFARCERVFLYKKGNDIILSDSLSEEPLRNYHEKLENEQILHGSFEQQMKQSHLLVNHPISPDSLNFYFKRVMRRMGFDAPTKVEIIDLDSDRIQVSGNKTTHLLHPFASEAYFIDTGKHIQVQAFVEFPFQVKILHSGWTQFTKWIFFSFACLLLALLISFRKFISHRIFDQNEDEPFIQILNRTEGIYKVADIVLCTKQQAFFYKKEKIKISARSMQLLETMILNEDHVLSKDFAYTVSKNENVLSSENNLQVAIKRLRHTLSIDPRIKIITIRNVGYQLTAQ